MVSYMSSKENICNNHIQLPCRKITHNDDESSEIEFEGWLHLGDPIRESDMNFNGRCGNSCSTNSQHTHSCQTDNFCCSNHGANLTPPSTHCRNSLNYICTHNSNTINYTRRNGRCQNCSAKNIVCGRQVRNDNEVYYVNNRQNAPTVVVQKPQTVVVRNKSRPPIVVQQPPPNVIVKNDPPQPIYVQNCPPNITVKNTEPPGYRNIQTIQNGNQFDKFNYEPALGRQSTFGIARNQTLRGSHRNHCIYHCKHPCYINF